MARRHRVFLTAAVLLNGLILAGCETGGISDKLGEMGDAVVDMIPGGGKKKLPGDRKPVFPEGIPGVAQGVPPELVKGNQPPPETAETQVPEPVKPEPEKQKPKKKKVLAQKPPPQRPVQQQPAAWPAPPPQQPQPAAQWPAPPTQQAPADTAWPAPPPMPPAAQTR
jgi:hypothetical protein